MVAVALSFLLHSVLTNLPFLSAFGTCHGGCIYLLYPDVKHQFFLSEGVLYFHNWIKINHVFSYFLFWHVDVAVDVLSSVAPTKRKRLDTGYAMAVSR